MCNNFCEFLNTFRGSKLGYIGMKCLHVYNICKELRMDIIWDLYEKFTIIELKNKFNDKTNCWVGLSNQSKCSVSKK